MKAIYKSIEGERLVLERLSGPSEALARGESAGARVHSRAETSVVVSGAEDAPALLQLHGDMANSAMWMGEITAFERFFRVYCIDMIDEPGLALRHVQPLRPKPSRCGRTMF